MKRIVLSSAVLALAVSTVGIAAADKPGDTDTTKTSRDTVTRDCGDGDVVSLTGSQVLWPPNHKMVPYSATATDGPSANPADAMSDDTTLMLSFDVVESLTGGDGNTLVDSQATGPNPATGDPSATVPFELRAERSGRSDGRTYIIDWVATFDGMMGSSMNTCSSADEGQSPFEIFVPHDQGRGNDA